MRTRSPPSSAKEGWGRSTARATSGSSTLRTSVALPEGLGIPTLSYDDAGSLATLALSPAGDQVAFVGFGDGEGALYLRRFDSFDAARLTKTEAAVAPFDAAPRHTALARVGTDPAISGRTTDALRRTRLPPAE